VDGEQYCHTAGILRPGSDQTFSAFLSGLEEALEYDVRVRAATAAGAGVWSAAATARTAEAAPTGKVQTLAVATAADSVTSTSVALTWEPPVQHTQNGVITLYRVTATRTSPDKFAENPSITVTTKDTTEFDGPEDSVGYTFTGLEKYAQYTFEVQAHTAVGAGPGETLAQRTRQDAPGKPQNPALRELTGVSDATKKIRVTWEPPLDKELHGILQSYTVYVTTQDVRAAKSAEMKFPISVSTLSKDVTGLQAGVDYTFEVTASTDDTEGGKEGTFARVYITASEAVPTAAPTAVGGSPRRDSVSVTWKDPPLAEQNGVISKYTIAWRRMEGQLFADGSLGSEKTAGLIVVTRAEANKKFGDDEVASYATDIDDLEAYVSYSFVVTPFTAVGPSTTSSTISVETLQGPPTGPVVSLEVATDKTPQQRAMNIVWGPPAPYNQNGDIAQYRVTYTPKPYSFITAGPDRKKGTRLKNAQVQERCIAGDAGCTVASQGVSIERTVSVDKLDTDVRRTQPVSLLLDDLEPYTSYDVEVYPLVSGLLGLPVCGGCTRVETLTTAPRAPPKPSAPVPVRDETDTHSKTTAIKVRWESLSDEWGPIVKVQMVVEPDGSNLFNLSSKINCANKVQDGYEEGIDCGGLCQPCTAGNLVGPPPLGTYEDNVARADADSELLAYIAWEKDMTGVGAADTGGTLIVGDEADNGNGKYTNGPLKSGTRHTFRLIAFTAAPPDTSAGTVSAIHLEADGTLSAASSTAASSSAATIAVVIILILILLLVVIVVVYRRRNGLSNDPRGLFGASNKDMPMTTPDNFTSYGSGAPDNSMAMHPMGASMASAYAQAMPQRPVPQAAPIIVPPVPQLPPVERHAIQVSDLPRVIRQMSANTDFAFSEEYECLETGAEFSREASKLEVNKMKNRCVLVAPRWLPTQPWPQLRRRQRLLLAFGTVVSNRDTNPRPRLLPLHPALAPARRACVPPPALDPHLLLPRLHGSGMPTSWRTTIHACASPSCRATTTRTTSTPTTSTATPTSGST